MIAPSAARISARLEASLPLPLAKLIPTGGDGITVRAGVVTSVAGGDVTPLGFALGWELGVACGVGRTCGSGVGCLTPEGICSPTGKGDGVGCGVTVDTGVGVICGHVTTGLDGLVKGVVIRIGGG